MSPCTFSKKALWAMADNEGTPETQQHVATCANCAAELAHMQNRRKQVKASLQTVIDTQLGAVRIEAAIQKINQRINEQSKKKFWLQRLEIIRFSLPKYSWAWAGVALVLGVLLAPVMIWWFGVYPSEPGVNYQQAVSASWTEKGIPFNIQVVQTTAHISKILGEAEISLSIPGGRRGRLAGQDIWIMARQKMSNGHVLLEVVLPGLNIVRSVEIPAHSPVSIALDSDVRSMVITRHQE